MTQHLWQYVLTWPDARYQGHIVALDQVNRLHRYTGGLVMWRHPDNPGINPRKLFKIAGKRDAAMASDDYIT